MRNIDSEKKTYLNIRNERLMHHIDSSLYENDDWGTIAFRITRKEVTSRFYEPMLQYNCIYLLAGHESDGQEAFYVGQAKKRNNGGSVVERLQEHAKSKTEPYREVWEHAIVFTNKSDRWKAQDLDALENALYNELPPDQRLNRSTPNQGGEDLDLYEDKLNQIKKLVRAIGYHVFEDRAKQLGVQQEDEPEIIIISGDAKRGKAEWLNNDSFIPEVITPDDVVHGMISYLDVSVWNSRSKFIDLSCKGGEYLRAICDRLLISPEMIRKFPDERERREYILNNQIYGIALSKVSQERTETNLYGKKAPNVKYIPGFIGKLMSIYRSKGDVHKLIQKEFGTMQFDVVIGNPPYQEVSQSIYPYFIEAGLDLAPRVCMIVKNNFLASDTIAPTRKRMIEAGITHIFNYPKQNELFKGVSVTVAIFNIDSINYSGKTTYKEIIDGKVQGQYVDTLSKDSIILNSAEEYSIYRKIVGYAKKSSFSKYILPDEAFRINSNGNVGRGDSTYYINDRSQKTDEYSVALVYMNNNKTLYTRFIKPEDVPNRADLIDTYKVIMGARISTNNSVLTNIRLIPPPSVTSKSWGVLYTDTDMNKTLAAGQYCKTKLFRFLVRLLCNRGGLTSISPYRFSLVPDQDFSSNSDIDWSKSVADIDKYLYQKYNLSPDEINYIESTINPYN